jgi:hypothetical protein
MVERQGILESPKSLEFQLSARFFLAAEQIPVERERAKKRVLRSSMPCDYLRMGHLVGVYPEGTLTRDKDCWPMVAKTGAARLAVIATSACLPSSAMGNSGKYCLHIVRKVAKSFRKHNRHATA